ncbi:sodium-dependent transporter [Hominifimenecus sp. rT4P-3]|uniref:sodium-dependent transporter n=1 Tax=Hominifimenecus sp. rT4P-3 TaxID=3242979 RepID=UPI003DA2EEE8
MERENFKSRLGFILISAGCAIGIGNVWRFPFVVGNHGGGFFVLFYLFFLIAVGVPVLTMEFSVGRASRQSAVKAYKVLEKPGQKWHIHGYIAMFGNYVLMMFYTTVAGWMLYYFYRYVAGGIEQLDGDGVGAAFGEMLSKPGTMAFWMLLIVLLGFFICSLGLQKGVERITKWMMLALLVLILVLAVHSILLPGGAEGLSFYLLPNWSRLKEAGVWNTISAAMNQSFFTLSLGIGAMAIFGSYLGKQKSLLGESMNIAALDTFVAIVAGLIIFPACFTYGVNPDSGPSLIFITLPNVFNQMDGGRLWGALFFLFMTFAAFSTIIAVFENIMSCCMDQWHWSRKKAALINVVVIGLASMPCVLGFNLWSGFQPLGAGSGVLDLEDFIVSNLLLPGGSLVYLLFCVSRFGWGFKNYLAEANTGDGVKVPAWLRFYFAWILPIIIFILLVQGVWGVLAKLFV